MKYKSGEEPRVGDIVVFTYTGNMAYSAEVGATAEVYEITDHLYVEWDRKNRLCHNQNNGGYSANTFDLVKRTINWREKICQDSK